MERLFCYFLLILAGLGCRPTYEATQTEYVQAVLKTIGEIPEDSLLLSGLVTDRHTGEPLIFSSVALCRAGMLFSGRETDFSGRFTFRFSPAEAEADYELKVSYVGYRPLRSGALRLRQGQEYFTSLSLRPGMFAGFPGCGGYFEVPIFDMDETASGATYSSDMLRRLPAFRGGMR